MVLQPVHSKATASEGSSRATRRRVVLRKRAALFRGRNGLLLISELAVAVANTETIFGKFAHAVLYNNYKTNPGLGRNVLPLPAICTENVDWPLDITAKEQSKLQLVGNWFVAGLNFLEHGGRVVPMPRRASALHRQVLSRIVARWWRLSKHIGDDTTLLGSLSGAFTSLARKNTAASAVPLRAANIDTVPQCGLVDPLPFLPPDLASLISNPDRLFNGPIVDAPALVQAHRGNRAEYVKSVRRLFRRGKLAFSRHAKHVADVFTLEKRDSSRLREVWNGSSLSGMAAEPPGLPWLATPASLANLEASKDLPLWMHSRDGEAFFDQLRAPRQLWDYFGRPAVTIDELCSTCVADADDCEAAPLDRKELDAHDPPIPISLPGSISLTPVSRCFPMGFSHASSMAQHTMVGTCIKAGFEEGQFLTNEMAIPPIEKPAISVATDDVGAYERASRFVATQRPASVLQSLDLVWDKVGIKAKDTKCYDWASSGVSLGIELIKGTFLAPKRSRLISLFRALLDLVHSPRSSPRDMCAYSGAWHWIMLLNRLTLSCFGEIYKFTMNHDDHRIVEVPLKVLSELGLCASWTFSLMLDLCRDWAPVVMATDGAQSFGYGVTYAQCHPTVTRDIAHQSHHSFHQVWPTNDNGMKPPQNCSKHIFTMPLRTDDFKTILSKKCEQNFHASRIEMGAVSLAGKWMSRQRRFHGKRVTLLVDARAVLFAIRKGRSSSGQLKFGLQCLAAHAIAADQKLHVAYIPSVVNPADPGSRGLVRTAGRCCRNPPGSRAMPKFVQYLHTLKRSVRRLRQTGMISEDSVRSWDSTCSQSTLGQPSLD